MKLTIVGGGGFRVLSQQAAFYRERMPELQERFAA
jgi:hypothetical protein